MFDIEIERLAEAILAAARAKGWTITTAESCTGGLVAAALTDIAGSSDVFHRGVVTYSNQAKTALLGVPSGLFPSVGAVSADVARAMAEGALAGSGAQVAVGVTGIAGPGGGSADKPVGLVWFGLARKGAATITQEMRFGDLGRGPVRMAAVRTALDLLFSGVTAA